MSAGLLVVLLLFPWSLLVGVYLAVRHWEGERRRRWAMLEDKFWKEHSEERTRETLEGR